MSDLENVGTQINAFAQESPLRRYACITGEEHAKRTILQYEGDRVVVDRVLPADKRQRRADERQRDAVICVPRVTNARVHDRHAIGRSRIEAIVICVSTERLPAIRDFRDANISQYR